MVFLDELKAGLIDTCPTGDVPLHIVALSGGADSTALLVGLKKLRLKLLAVHINHALRGLESDEDEAFCRSLCEKLSVRLVVHLLPAETRDEASLRNARYAALGETALAEGAVTIHTAHTMDDQVETMLFRLFRGTSPNGLAGIPSRRNLFEGVVLSRPLLNVTRRQIIDFLAEQSMSFRTDSSNLSNDYSRNFIRNELMPRIFERFGDVTARVEQFRKLLSDDLDVLQEISEMRSASMFSTPSGTRVTAFLVEPPAIQRRVIAMELASRGIEVSSDRVERILDIARQGGVLSLSADWQACCKGGCLSFEEINSEDIEPSSDSSLNRELIEASLNVVAELGCAVQIVPETQSPSAFPGATANDAFVDLSSAEKPLVVRRRRPGDVIVPFGMTEAVRLKKYLQTHRKSNGAHAGMPVVIASGNEIIWVPGVGLSNKVRVKDRPTHRMRFIPLETGESPLC